MQTITTAGLDIAKSVFQVHGAGALPPVAPWGAGSAHACTKRTFAAAQQLSTFQGQRRHRAGMPLCLLTARIWNVASASLIPRHFGTAHLSGDAIRRILGLDQK